MYSSSRKHNILSKSPCDLTLLGNRHLRHGIHMQICWSVAAEGPSGAFGNASATLHLLIPIIILLVALRKHSMAISSQFHLQTFLHSSSSQQSQCQRLEATPERRRQHRSRSRATTSLTPVSDFHYLDLSMWKLNCLNKEHLLTSDCFQLLALAAAFFP